MKYISFWVCVVPFCVALSLLQLGCGRDDGSTSNSKDPDPVTSEVKEDPFQVFLNTIDTFYSEGKTNEIVTLCKDALDDDSLAEQRVSIFLNLLQIYFETGQHAAAQDTLNTIIADEDYDLLRAGLNPFVSSYMSIDKDVALSFCNDLLGKELDDDIRVSLWQNVARIYIAHDELALFSARLDELLTSVDPTNYAVLLDPILRQATSRKMFEPAEALLEKIAKNEALSTRSDVANLLRLRRLDLFLGQEQLDAAEKHLIENVNDIDDNVFAGYTTRLMNIANKKDMQPMIDRISVFILKLDDKKSVTRDRGAVAWARFAASGPKPNYRLFLERIGVLITSKITPRHIYRLYQREYYNIMSNTAPELRRMCIDVGLQLSRQDVAWEEIDQNIMQLLLDGTFYLKDFNKSLEILHAGIPGKDEAWHTMLINKVSAHVAEEEGRFMDAIEGYGRHMEHVKIMEDLANPETQRIVIRESVLAFNEKRIGDLYIKAGKKEEAAKAYNRARELYNTALEKTEEGKPDYLEIQQELKNVPVDDL